MVASVLIIAFSLVLFAYWFRYSCILLLRNRAEQKTASDDRFQIASVRQRLKTELELDPLHASLQRDYNVFSYLVRHAAGFELETFEDRLLVWDYKFMQAWYRLTRTAAPQQARAALVEMAEILGVLVDRITPKTDVRNEA
jgi:hypothetical protein